MRRRARVLVFLLLSIPAAAQVPRIGIIDFYGLRTVNEQQVRDALQIAVGDSVMPESFDGEFPAVQPRVILLLGARRSSTPRRQEIAGGEVSGVPRAGRRW